MKFRTKPFEIEAFKFEGSAKAVKDEFPDIALKTYAEGGGVYIDEIKVWDYLQETWVKVNLFDYVIKGMKGEYYPCDPEVFEAKYERIVPDEEKWAVIEMDNGRKVRVPRRPLIDREQLERGKDEV